MNVSDNDKPGFFEDRHTHLPKGTGALGMWLFLVTLSILFAASLFAYLFIRMQSLSAVTNPTTGDVIRQAGPALGSIAIPSGLWVSTTLMLASSLTIHLALRAVREERLLVFRRCLWATLALAALFLVIQTPSLMSLLSEHQAHQELRRDNLNLGAVPQGMIFFLIIVHALHLIGGLIPLSIVTFQASRSRYDHESYNPVTYVAMYWHFLDVVWLCLFFGLLLIG